MAKADLTAHRVREILSYSPETGVFSWRLPLGRRSNVGSAAGTKHRGYVHIRIDGVAYRAHRLAVFYVTGAWPVLFVDHANGDRSDNRYCNLRECTSSQNNVNRAGRSGLTGVKGVRRTPEGRYQTRISVNFERATIGTYETLSEAAAAYAAAATRLHGDFAKTC